MKNTRQIFDSFLADSQIALAAHLRARQNLARLKLILPADMRAGIVSIFYRAPKLLFGFNHPSHVYNFNHYKKKDIMYCLRRYASEFEPFLKSIGAGSMDEFLSSAQLVAYMPKSAHAPSPTPTPAMDSARSLHFAEPASGSFSNSATDPKLHAQFERLRTLIRAHTAQAQTKAINEADRARSMSADSRF